MATKTLRRAQLPCCSFQSSSPTQTTQIRHASLLRRPIRPYTFTQLVTLSDGSTYLHRTTSPLPIFRSTKDTRNSPLWQPSLAALRNQEQDEAGRLRAFRERFGRGWDATEVEEEEEGNRLEGPEGKKEVKKEREEAGDSLMDLISGGYTENTTQAQREERAEMKEAVEMIMVKREGVMVKVPKTAEKASKGVKKTGW